MAEQPFVRLLPMVRALASAVEPLLDRPFAVFGHSMGGLVAFELVRMLRRRGLPQPCHLFISAAPPPSSTQSEAAFHCASDAVLIDHLRTLNGSPPEVLANEELMKLALPVIRADFEVLESYMYREDPPLDLATTVLGGRDDQMVRRASLEGWRKHLSRPHLQLVDGDHFYVHDRAPEIASLVSKRLRYSLETDRAAKIESFTEKVYT